MKKNKRKYEHKEDKVLYRYSIREDKTGELSGLPERTPLRIATIGDFPGTGKPASGHIPALKAGIGAHPGPEKRL